LCIYSIVVASSYLNLKLRNIYNVQPLFLLRLFLLVTAKKRVVNSTYVDFLIFIYPAQILNLFNHNLIQRELTCQAQFPIKVKPQQSLTYPLKNSPSN